MTLQEHLKRVSERMVAVGGYTVVQLLLLAMLLVTGLFVGVQQFDNTYGNAERVLTFVAFWSVVPCVGLLLVGWGLVVVRDKEYLRHVIVLGAALVILSLYSLLLQDIMLDRITRHGVLRLAALALLSVGVRLRLRWPVAVHVTALALLEGMTLFVQTRDPLLAGSVVGVGAVLAVVAGGVVRRPVADIDLFVIALAATPVFAFYGYIPGPVYLLALLFVPLAWLYPRLDARLCPHWGWDALTVIVLILLGLDLAFPYDRFHHNAILGPVHGVTSGHVPFVTDLSQYGIGLTYGLAGVFQVLGLPISYAGLSLMVNVMMLGTAFVMYFQLRLVTRAWLLPMLTMVAYVVVVFHRAYWDVPTHPTHGELRYGALHLLLLFATIRTLVPRYRRVGWLGEVLVLGVAPFWSYEAGLFTGLLYVALFVYETLCTLDRPWRQPVWRFVGQVGTAVAITLLLYGGHILYSLQVTGMRPYYLLYSGYLRGFSVVTGMVFTFWTPALISLLILLLSLLSLLVWLIITADRRQLLRCLPLYGFAWIGVLQYLYWIRVPLLETIPQFTATSIVLAGFWTHQRFQSSQPRAYLTLHMLAFYALGLVLFTGALKPMPLPQRHYLGQELYAAVMERRALDFNLTALQQLPVSYVSFRNIETLDTDLPDVLSLIDRYAADATQIALLLPTATRTDALIRTGKGAIYPITDYWLVPPNPMAGEWLLAHPIPLAEGDWLIALEDDSAYHLTLDASRAFHRSEEARTVPYPQPEIRQQLEAAYDLEWIEVLPSGVGVARVVAQANSVAPLTGP